MMCGSVIGSTMLPLFVLLAESGAPAHDDLTLYML